MSVSPLNYSNDVKHLKSIRKDELIEAWMKIYGIDISSDISSCERIDLFLCRKTGLKFFSPNGIAGSDKFYEKLEKFDWYYMPQKWEHDVAIDDLNQCYKILEVGCGYGTFVSRLRKELSSEAEGIEINSKAVESAIKKGIPISSANLYDLSKEKSGLYDAICAFQVLEHIVQPREFLEAMVRLLKPGGKLILAVPNAKSFIQFDQNDLLNQPPHHMSQWCEQSFLSLTNLLPIQVKRLEFEPLAQYHVDWYSSIQIARCLKVRLLQSIALRLSHYTLNPILKKFPFIRSRLTGHTIYVCFEKLND